MDKLTNGLTMLQTNRRRWKLRITMSVPDAKVIMSDVTRMEL